MKFTAGSLAKWAAWEHHTDPDGRDAWVFVADRRRLGPAAPFVIRRWGSGLLFEDIDGAAKNKARRREHLAQHVQSYRATLTAQGFSISEWSDPDRLLPPR